MALCIETAAFVLAGPASAQWADALGVQAYGLRVSASQNLTTCPMIVLNGQEYDDYKASTAFPSQEALSQAFFTSFSTVMICYLVAYAAGRLVHFWDD